MSEYTFALHEPVQLHHTAHIGHGSVLYPFCTILEGTTLGAGCVVWPGVMIGRHCLIGEGTRLHPGAAIPDGTVIGAYVFVGAHVVLTDVRVPLLRAKAQEVHRPPVIEDDVVLGSNCVIMPGVIVGKGAVVGAGAIVTKDVSPGWTVAGNPARRILRPRSVAMPLNEAGEWVTMGGPV